MYVTRPLSLYKTSPESLSAPPPEGPNSGYLVVQDEESMTPCCFGLCKSLDVDDLPLPSNKLLNFNYDSDDDDELFAIPVINHPLSANRYYAIKTQWKHKGEAYTSSKEEETESCCGGSYIRNAKPRPLDPEDIYQQFQLSTSISCTNSNIFSVKSVAPDGHPPRFLRRSNDIHTSIRTSKDFLQDEATGLSGSLRARLPDFNFTLSSGEVSEPVVVGKWYSPFMFIQEGKLKDQVKKSVYYEITLEQKWERIFVCDHTYGQKSKVIVDVVIPTEVAAIGGKSAVRDGRNTDGKVVWFQTISSVRDEPRVGLSSLLVERMIWEQERFGWVSGKEKEVRVIREEECGGIGLWARFGCYVLVERFVVKRMDGSLVLTYDFKHTNQIRTIWE